MKCQLGATSSSQKVNLKLLGQFIEQEILVVCAVNASDIFITLKKGTVIGEAVQAVVLSKSISTKETNVAGRPSKMDGKESVVADPDANKPVSPKVSSLDKVSEHLKPMLEVSSSCLPNEQVNQ